jgi:hypothetical protein
MSLTGVGMNKLRPILLLEEDEVGAVAGKFCSILGRDPHVRILTGTTNPIENGKQMLGFAVRFQIESPSPGYGHVERLGKGQSTKPNHHNPPDPVYLSTFREQLLKYLSLG